MLCFFCGYAAGVLDCHFSWTRGICSGSPGYKCFRFGAGALLIHADQIHMIVSNLQFEYKVRMHDVRCSLSAFFSTGNALGAHELHQWLDVSA